MKKAFSEQAVLFGGRNALVGILTRAEATAAGRPVIVILNTGIIHRVGHHRMYVSMARCLAAAGYTVLRFDFSGIGDSEPRVETLAPADSCLADIREALDWLQRDRPELQVVLIGLCSGADHAVMYGHTDARVAALVLMDPTIPMTLRYYVHYIAPRLLRPGSWLRVLTGRSRAARLWTAQAPRKLLAKWTSRGAGPDDLPPSAVIEAHYRKTVERGLRILAIFTEDTTRQTYPDQMIDALPGVAFGDRLKLEFFYGSDHTFVLQDDRRRLIDLTRQWIDGLPAAAGRAGLIASAYLIAVA